MAPHTVTVYIDANRQMFLEEVPVDIDGLHAGLLSSLEGHAEGAVVLRSDKTVPVQYVVNVIDVVEKINSSQRVKHKVILATQPHTR